MSSDSILPTEHIDPALADLDVRATSEVLSELLSSQQRAVHAVHRASSQLARAIDAAAVRLHDDSSRLVLLGAGASGRLAVQDGAELWPTYGWPEQRLILSMAGGPDALTRSLDGVEDDEDDALQQVQMRDIGPADVVLAVAASGRSPWTCRWLEEAANCGALTIGLANNPNTRLLNAAEHAVFLDSGAEVLAGSTRMASGTAQKVALNLFSTALMVRLNRTYGNLMVDMAASNRKLDDRRIRMVQAVRPEVTDEQAQQALDAADGWVKLAVLLACGATAQTGRKALNAQGGSLRAALRSLGF